MIYMENWRICTSTKFPLGFEGDNEVTALEIAADLAEDWDLKVDVAKDGETNIIQLTRDGEVYRALLTASMLADGGTYQMQVRGTLGEKVRHSNIFFTTVFNSINAADAFPPVLPSEFEQMEGRLTALNQNPPRPGEDGTWLLYNPDTGSYEKSDIPLPDNGGGGTAYQIGHGLKLEGDLLSVNTVDDFEGDNTLPITASAVQSTVGNIEILLGTI